MPDSPRSIGRLLLLNFVVAGAYIALAMQAKLAFAWEAIAVTLWLPAGLANGAVLIYGPAVAPAVAFANLISSACDPAGHCTADPWFIPIALAAAGQALLVRSVLHRQRLLHDSLSRIPRLMRFLLWAGPAGCWPAAATYAVSVLASDGNRAPGLTRALFWWVGDSLGSLLLLPLLLVLLPLGAPLWQERRGVVLRPLLALLFMLSLVTFLGKELAESIAQVPRLVEPLQLLRLLLSVTLLLVAFGGVGLLLHVDGMLLESQRLLRRSRLAADAAGALLHEIGQPLLRLHLLMERLAEALKRWEAPGALAEVAAAQRELDNLSTTSRGIQELTLSGMRDSTEASLQDAMATVQAQVSASLDRLDQQLRLSLPTPELRLAIGQAQLEAALRNLVLNASHAAGDGGVIRLEAERLGRELIVRVEDSGPGFDPQASSRIGFRMLSSWGGQGIGLLIVRRVVDEAEGHLSVRRSSKLGGACVVLQLPLITSRRQQKR